MSESKPTSTPDFELITSALPDIQSTPTSSKKPKLLHAESSCDSGSSEAGPSRLSPPDDDEGGDEANGARTPVVAAIPLPEEVIVKEEFYDLRMGWSGKLFELKVGGNDMVYDFRHQIELLTNVPPERQKLIGLTKGKLSSEMDSVRFGSLGVKHGVKFTLIGTPEADSFKDRARKSKEKVDDFDVTYSALAQVQQAAQAAQQQQQATMVAPADDPRNKRKIQEVIKSCPITIMNDPRPGKRLLVLDLDYTIVDTKPLLEGSLPAEECARPGLHDFLEKVYPHYDIVVWSQTHWRWLESKLVEIGMIGGDRNYRISFVADRTSMFPVFTQRDGQPFKHEVKPLAYFWASFPHWSARNSIHIDDLSRNFALNPGEGLKIRAYKGAGTHDGMGDQELIKLGNYLLGLAERCDDFTAVDHSQWKKLLRRPPQSQPAETQPVDPQSQPPPPSGSS